MVKLEFLNQTDLNMGYLHESLQVCLKIRLYCMKKFKKWTKYGHAMLGPLLGQNTSIFFRTTVLITNIIYACK